ncbi:hypothetical protein GH714_037906 [Hevea brasiliensis]|uniref:DUF547 domain-containing protein n=1 Tax=Hevea brasiliensis TaxID=3981 RepID=A0A6A6KAE7_HEVBR|nr:hypothetical protein GH714_037906 [Hevea brasiliensis]
MASPSSPQGHLSYFSLASFSDSPVMNSFMKNPSVDMEHGSEVSEKYCKIDPYNVPGKVDWIEGIGAYSTAVEVSWLSVGKKELEYASGALKRFRLLVEQLAEVVPSRLSCTEKLAFWINVYNALIMHAFLAYGVPRSDIKLFSLMQKALLLALQKSKVIDEQKFSIDLPEPLLAFALSCGMHSSRHLLKSNITIDVDDYFIHKNTLRSSRIFLFVALSPVIRKGKLLVPKLLYCFAKGIVEDLQLPEWICQFLSPEQAATVKDSSSKHKWRLLGARSFSVIPFDSRFRFLFIL